MFDKIQQIISQSKKVLILQAENPDGDSLSSAMALEEILGDLGKDVALYCPVDMPKHIRYINGWDRVSQNFPKDRDLVIIVDTAADILLSKTTSDPANRNFLENHNVVVIDHHLTESDLSFDHNLLQMDAISTGEVIYRLAKDAGWTINKQAAENIMISIMADSLGLTSEQVEADTFHIAAELAELGAKISDIETRRRALMKKSADILGYKADLIKRIEYLSDGQVALVHIPWEEIQKYSDAYNPSVLVLDEMRLVEGVEIAVAIKTYPDGKLTGKIRSNLPIAETVAGYFGGGGHAYAAGFRIYEDISKVKAELIDAVKKALQDETK